MAQYPNGQSLLFGGTRVTVTPTESFSAVLDRVVLWGGSGEVQAALIGGTHCNPP